VIPDAVILISNPASKINETVRTNAAGEYDFPALPEGRYVVKVLKPGFQPFNKPDVLVTSGGAVKVDANLELGRISEMMQVVAQGQPRAQAAGNRNSSGAPQRIRVGGNVQAAKVIKSVRPVYPAHLAAQGIEGTVMLEAVVGNSGTVVNVAVLNSQVHPDFVRAATEAVSQWVYSSTLLNGQPVEVITSVTVDFKLVQ
jgi:TonB family protein